jgi:hypothetical protein
LFSRRVAGLALLIVAVGGAPSVDATASSNIDVRLFRGRLSVHAREVPLQLILTQISRVSGISIRVDRAEAARLGQALTTVDFEAVNLDDALRRLLNAENLILVYSASGLEEARVYRAGERRSEERTVEASALPSGLSIDRMARLDVAHETHEVARVARLRTEALGHDDVRRRSRALEALVGGADQQAALETMVEVLERESDSAFLRRALDIARKQEGLPLEPLVKLALNSPDPAVRVQALKLLNERGRQDSRVRGVLGTAANDPDVSVRQAAVRLLRKLAANSRSSPIPDAERNRGLGAQ